MLVQTASRLLGFERPLWVKLALMSVAVGVLIRTTWNLLRPTSGAYGEAINVAIALSEGNGFADAYRIGQGPTAHVLPLQPLLASFVYRLLGAKSLPAEFLLSTWSICLAITSYVFYNHLFRRLGVSQNTLFVAFVSLCLVPIYITQEAVDFRVWDGGLAVALAAGAMLLFKRTEVPAHSRWQVYSLAILLSLLVFVQPLLGIGVCAGIVLHAFSWSWRQRLPLLTAFLVCLALLLSPWIIRNQAALGHPVLLRSNGGLELAIGMNPSMVEGSDPKAAFEQRLASVHPYVNDEAYREVLAAGEVAYSNRLGRSTAAWMFEHPKESAILIISHIRSTFMPQPWIFTLIGNPFGAPLRAAIASLIGITGLLGLCVVMWRREWSWLVPAMAVIVPAILMSPFQPVPRYIYLYHGILTFSGAYFVSNTLQTLSRVWLRRSLLQ